MSRGQGAMREKPLVLVAEDDPAIRKMIGLQLLHIGADVIEVGDGVAAIAYLQTNIPDMVCLDLSLPITSGFEVFRQLRRDPRTTSVPVLVVTGRTGLQDEATVEELKPEGYLPKPLKFRVFCDVARKLLEPFFAELKRAKQ